MVARMATSLHALPDGAALAYTDQGRGRPLLLLHGVTMSSRFFERNVEPLAEAHRVIAIDFRGHGASPHHEGGHTVAQYARDVRHLIEALDLRDVVLVGWSMGSMVAWDYLRQFRGDHRVAGHVVVSQSPSDLKRDDWEHGFLDVPGLVEFLREAQEDWSGALGGFVPEMFMDERSPDELAWMVGQPEKVGANAGTAILIDQTFRDYREDLRQIDVPTLLAWGRDEKLVPISAGEEMQRAHPGRRARVLRAQRPLPDVRGARGLQRRGRRASSRGCPASRPGRRRSPGCHPAGRFRSLQSPLRWLSRTGRPPWATGCDSDTTGPISSCAAATSARWSTSRRASSGRRRRPPSTAGGPASPR